MSEPPLISIVIPSFNQAVYLEQAILSVFEQQYPALEVMVVDGGSTDGSVEVIKKYHKRLAWWISEPDRGQADAINKGLERAKGEYCAWLNSDDYYLPGAFKEAVEIFSRDPNLGLVYGDVLAVDGSGKKINLIRYGEWGLDGLVCFRIIGQPSVFLRRSVVLKSGLLDQRFHYLLDHHLWLRVALLSEMRYVPRTWAAARFHAAAKNVAMASKFGSEAYAIVEWMESQGAFSTYLAAKRNQILAGAHRINARYLSEGGLTGQSLAVYRKCFECDPATALRDWKRIGITVARLAGIRIQRKYEFSEVKDLHEQG